MFFRKILPDFVPTIPTRQLTPKVHSLLHSCIVDKGLRILGIKTCFGIGFGKFISRYTYTRLFRSNVAFTCIKFFEFKLIKF